MNRKVVIEPDIVETILKIHSSPYRIVLAVTGGGTEVIGELLRHGRGSETILESIVPYSKESLIDFIGKEPYRYASDDTARDMAMSAYRRAVYLDCMTGNPSPQNLIGIGVTCKLTKNADERKGREHEIHFAFQSYSKAGVSGIYLKDNACRQEQEKLASWIILEKIASICCIEQKPDNLPDDIPENTPDYAILQDEMIRYITEEKTEVKSPVAELLLRTLSDLNSKDKKTIVPVKVDMQISDANPKIIFPGSFNPCHKNHIHMAKIASEKYNSPVSFEISLANVDKPPIDYISLEKRISSLMKYMNEEYAGNLYLTNSPLFADKAILFPNSVFIIGTDTLDRLFNEKYYRKGEDKKSLLDHFHKYNIRFLVFRRMDSDVPDDIDIPDICDIIPLDIYADDGTSSTMIREQGN